MGILLSTLETLGSGKVKSILDSNESAQFISSFTSMTNSLGFDNLLSERRIPSGLVEGETLYNYKNLDLLRDIFIIMHVGYLRKTVCVYLASCLRDKNTFTMYVLYVLFIHSRVHCQCMFTARIYLSQLKRLNTSLSRYLEFAH